MVCETITDMDVGDGLAYHHLIPYVTIVLLSNFLEEKTHL